MARISPGGQSLFPVSDRSAPRLDRNRGIVRGADFRVPDVVAELSFLEHAGAAPSRASRRLRLGRVRCCGKSNPSLYAAGHVCAPLFDGCGGSQYPATGSE